MSQYKVGDVAALFSKPKKPTTESGKKLQSLFKEFLGKDKKSKVFSQIAQKEEDNFSQGNIKAQNQRVSKNEKRKFSAVTNEESDELSNTKKFKKVKKQDANATEFREKHITVEQDFPRKKKSFKSNKNNLKHNVFDSFEKDETALSNPIKEVLDDNFKSTNKSIDKEQNSRQEFPKKKKSYKTNKNSVKNNGFNTFEEDKTALSNNIKEVSAANFKSKEKSIDKKEISNFIKKLKQEREIAMNGTIKSSGNDMSDEDEYATGTLFKEDNEELIEQVAKKQKKKKYNNDNFVPNKKLGHTSGNDTLESKTSQPKVSERAEPDFLKLPDLKSEDEEERLSRTLFVGNLPVNTNRKAVRTLFSPFGEIEQIRYHGIETDKAKIFNENGPQTLNAKNYAADSVPGFIVFCDRQSAVKALSLSGSLFKGRHITVDFALPAGTKKIYDDKRSIFIGNLPFDCQDESIWEAFSECGRIENVRIVRDKKTGIGKGFGYVQFSTVLSKENALGLKDVDIQGRTIRIKPVDSNQSGLKKAKNPPPVKSDSFKSQAIRIKKKNKDTASRKSIKKIMKKQKNLHKKKRVANILQKSMKM